MFPVLKRHNESLALGVIASRVLKATLIVVGIISVLSIVTLREDFIGAAGADTASLLVAGKSLVTIHKWTLLFGPGVCSGVGSGLLLGYLLYRPALVPPSPEGFKPSSSLIDHRATAATEVELGAAALAAP